MIFEKYFYIYHFDFALSFRRLFCPHLRLKASLHVSLVQSATLATSPMPAASKITRGLVKAL